MITVEQLEESVQWFFENARALGAARQRMVYTERMAERMKALVMKKYSDLPVSAQEREAKASPELHQAYINEAEAAGEYEMLRTLKNGHEARIEAWRTLESTARSLHQTSAPREQNRDQNQNR